MSGREWKPGDVAAWDIDGDTEVIYRFMGGPDFDIPEWQTAHNGCGYPRDRNVRPLVVVDPEDLDQVGRLAKDFHESDHIAPWHDLHSETRAQITDALQAALRSLIEPPKPEEPKGAAALVEDAGGDWWARMSRGADGAVWHRIGQPHRSANWSSIAAVKVLSQGVTP